MKRLFDDEFLQRLQRLGLLAKRISATAPAGGHRRGPKMGDGLEFADHRAYAPGDDLRFLDWHYYARMERLLLRLFHEHSEGEVSLLLDCSESMAMGQLCKFDHARRMAAALAYVAMASLDRVNIFPFADALAEGLKTGRNRARIVEVLGFLEGLEAAGPTRLARASEQFARASPRPGTVIVLTDMIDIAADLADALRHLRAGGEVIALHVVDRADASPVVLGPSRLAAAETKRQMSVNVTEQVLASYRRRWGQLVRGLERTCLSGGSLYIQAPTSTPFDRLVLETLHRAGLLTT